MGFFNLFHRDRLRSSIGGVSKTAIVDELDNLSTAISAWAEVEHNDDGTHNVIGSGRDFVPVGAQIRWPMPTAPSGWLLCNGANISRAAYPKLFRVIGISSGAGNGTTTFTLPTVANFIILAA